VEWANSIRTQCIGAGTPLFIKQLEINGKCERDINRFPEDLQIQEYPV